MCSERAFQIRRATIDDVAALGRLGALLVGAHYAFDRQRFLAPGTDTDAAYGAFLRAQLADPDAAVFVAEHAARVVGYAFASIEPRSWKELREACAFVHDLAVEPDARAIGVGTALADAAIDWSRRRGVPRVVLWTAAANREAHALFTRLGFRDTMIEMTREL